MKKSPSSDWREPIYDETNLLKTSEHPFRVSSCGNVAFHRRIFNDSGVFDEEFSAWGAEDNEFGTGVTVLTGDNFFSAAKLQPFGTLMPKNP